MQLSFQRLRQLKLKAAQINRKLASFNQNKHVRFNKISKRRYRFDNFLIDKKIDFLTQGGIADEIRQRGNVAEAVSVDTQPLVLTDFHITKRSQFH
ncbi:MAG: hypothetical protein IAC78_01360 [Firmicutes bacterium]|uniref:Uncharacterized protein n=1 Tax=Candidatus Scatoplasma merdavium TaxID=2840932 RepID=A0A9D9GSH0_9BACL|nr:hypothetical protein [Candidatus Scatoplasma merdavium]